MIVIGGTYFNDAEEIWIHSDNFKIELNTFVEQHFDDRKVRTCILCRCWKI